jgi:hypothetical protein
VDENVSEIRELVRCDRVIADELDNSKETVRKILVQDLGMRKQLVPQNLTEEEKDRRLTLCMDFAEHLQEDNFLDCIITGDETCCYQYNPNANCQSMEWRLKNSHRSKMPLMSKSKIKTMVICFFDIRVILHFEFVPEGTTVNQTIYM